MRFINLIRAHVFRHSKAAILLGKFDLARAISLKKLEKAQLQQQELLLRIKYLEGKIERGDILKHFYTWNFNRLSKQLETTTAKIGKYGNRAIEMQVKLEAKLTRKETLQVWK